MWTFEQRTGRLRHNDKLVATGYSGYGPGKNDPLSQHLVGIGPIPQGAYWIGEAFDTETHGPIAIRLVPIHPGTETFGRSGFMVHGDSREHPGAASHGCIVVGPKVREDMATHHDKLLVVLSGTWLDVEVA